MKILLSAYACEPNKGSEPGVGWNWAIELANLGHDVWVLTRANNQQNIETELEKFPQHSNLHFIYYDLPSWMVRLKKIPGGIYLYSYMWQYGLYKFLRKDNRYLKYDIIHHVTFVSIRLPSFLCGMGKRFVFGPVAGGERAPWRLRFGFPLRGIVLDFLRDMGNFWVKCDPFVRKTFRKADMILVTSQQTKVLIPSTFHSKTCIRLAIGLNKKWGYQKLKIPTTKKSPFKMLFVGRFLYWKGIHLGLSAMAEIVKTIPDIQLTMVGQGPEKDRWKNQAKLLGIDRKIEWIAWVSQNELIKLYQTHHLFIFPSLHDSGGMVVLEALACGLPVVCLDLGGPGKIIDNSCGIKIPVAEKSQNKVIRLLANGMQNMILNKYLYEKMKFGSIERAKKFRWDYSVELMSNNYCKKNKTCNYVIH